ncbi:MAG: thiamine pyrophosphate-binding protein [Thermoleophilia bacterium]|nr:thiamine pyrophosphate-binding protein [Thermoleophilia bacterium]
MTGACDALLAVLADQGVTHLFGNPGSTELPLIDALSRQNRVRYVLGLHEAGVVGMADGYAQSTGRIAAVNLHTGPGVATAMAALMNARRARVPLLVTAGTQHTALRGTDPFLGGDVVAIAREATVHAEEVDAAASLPAALDRAARAALTPPCGPALVGIPLDVQTAAAAGEGTRAPWAGAPAPEPPPRAVARAAELLAVADAPAIVAGDGVAHAGGGAAVAALALRLGAPVWGEPHAARAPVAWNDALWAGYLPPMGDAIRATLAVHDVVLALGCPVFRVFGHSPGPPLASGTHLVHADADADGLGRNARTDVALHADPRRAAEALLVALPRRVPGARARVHAAAAAHAARRRASWADPVADPRGITPHALARAVDAHVRPGDMLVDEGLTSGRALRRSRRGRPGNWLAHRGSALGWGLPACVGGAIAHPGRYCTCLQGDGGLVFGAHALWTAARHGARVGLVVADNGGYEILRAGLRDLTGRPGGAWPGLGLGGYDPGALCAAFGASVERVERPRDLASALAGLRARSADGPACLVVRVAPG